MLFEIKKVYTIFYQKEGFSEFDEGQGKVKMSEEYL